MTRQKRSLTPAVIDACCLIDLLSSGQAEAILRAAGHVWHLPDAVQGEVQYIRQHDPAQPGSFINVPADLTSLIASGLLTPCQPDDAQEQARFVHYATIFRSDGEAMCLALAESRGWVVATDDRKAIRIAGQAGLTVISCPQHRQGVGRRNPARSDRARRCPHRHPDAGQVRAEPDDARCRMVVSTSGARPVRDGHAVRGNTKYRTREKRGGAPGEWNGHVKSLPRLTFVRRRPRPMTPVRVTIRATRSICLGHHQERDGTNTGHVRCRSVSDPARPSRFPSDRAGGNLGPFPSPAGVAAPSGSLARNQRQEIPSLPPSSGPVGLAGRGASARMGRETFRRASPLRAAPCVPT